MLTFLHTLLQWIVLILGILMIGGTLLSLSRHPHWLIREWDFPRVQIAITAALCGIAYGLFFFEGAWPGWLFLIATGLCVAWQCYKIYPYTRLAPKRVKRARHAAADHALRLVITNVKMQNRRFDRLIDVVRRAEPDVLLAVETDQDWDEHLRTAFEPTHPYHVRQPQRNMYGMVLYSRLKLIEPQIRFILQDDIPSIHTGIELRGGQRVFLHGLHPKPPEPLRDQDSAPRDAELVVVGREIADQTRPTIVAGDLNDVAWSYTTGLFQRISHLLDPREGRGFYNSFNANFFMLRFPLDHVFHSDCFKLTHLRRLDHVGSDHFPILIELSHEPEGEDEQPRPQEQAGEEQAAQEMVEEAKEQGETVNSAHREMPGSGKASPGAS